jgi:hypothetical protein
MELKGYGAEFMIGAQNAEININYRTCNGGVSGHTPTTWKWRAGSSSNWSDHYMGLIQSSSSMRAPIFYDSNNTTYYTDPGSTSNIASIAVKGEIAFPASNLSTHGAGSRPSYSIYQEGGAWTSPFPDLCIAMHTGIKFGAHANYNGMRFYDDSTMATQVMSINNSADPLGASNVYVTNNLQAGSSLRAPIFYDSNDTAYYTNPASTSRTNTIDGNVFSGNISTSGDGQNNYPFRLGSDYNAYMVAAASNTWGLFWAGNAGARYGTNGNGGPGNIWGNSGNPNEFCFVGSDSTKWTIYGNDGRSWQAGYATNAASYRAPIFYDSNNTAFYCDPASTSKFNDLWTTDGGNNGTSPRWDTSFYVAQSQHYYGHSTTQTMYVGESNHIHIRSIGEASGDFRAPIFYDSNNTSYYVNPDSTSSIVNLTVANTISGSITRTAGTSGYGHAGTGMWPFYNWGGSNGGGSAPTSSSYTTGISIGSHPGDQAYGWQMANNMWNAGIWYRTYNSSFSSWYKLLDNTTNTQTINSSLYVNNDVGIGFTSGSIGGKLNIKRTTAGINIKNDLGGSLSSSTIGLHQYTSASMNSGGYHMVFQAAPTSGSDTNMLLCNINGNLRNRNNSYGQYSDRNIKENIVDATSKLEDVKKLRIRNFNFIGDDLKQIGLIAQETELVFPGLVENDLNPQGDEVKSLKYSVLVPILVKAMQEQQAIIDDLKSRLETLENQ